MSAPSYFEYQERRTQRSNAHELIEKIAGPRFVSIDLDVVITADLRPLWNRPEDVARHRGYGKRATRA